ncbi:hypothetical protein [Jatrophihabitans lederbergiae]|uniref:Uncharacterized protein n=1 Tax=Jatrophihabitans lederbergiae TaxID=3075547 RepID=A0ABU2JBF9_9ACTN|nr:hypothetical protein [Jatrophihabitans sp. DSM 44399]MDT0262323.1 hypothetical protein [Jatrophihabitans sp. DSM 44399]
MRTDQAVSPFTVLVFGELREAAGVGLAAQYTWLRSSSTAPAGTSAAGRTWLPKSAPAA